MPTFLMVVTTGVGDVPGFRRLVRSTEGRRRRWRCAACRTTWCSLAPASSRQSAVVSRL